jgi:glycosyltransferase involved in cell wall biosynthesis
MPDRQRILHMGPDPAIGGGMAASLRGLLSSPLASRYTLDVVPTYRGPEPLRRLVFFCIALACLVVWSLRGRGRIAHIHATVRGSMYRKSICVLLAKALRRRVVLHVHSGAGDIAAYRAGLGRASLGLFGVAFSLSDSVLAVSSASAAALERAYGLTGVGVVPNAAPLVPAFHREEPAAGAAVRVIYLGGFANPAKGGDLMVEALALAGTCEGRLRATLAGPGELPPAAAELVERDPSVTWAGWLEPNRKDELLRTAQLLAMPSRSEGLPMVLLEAMAYEMAIVATEVGGIPEVLDSGRDGLLVAPEQPAALAEAICRLAGDPQLRRRLAASARGRAERFDAVEVADQLDAVYSALC